jgi:hypothetical protein
MYVTLPPEATVCAGYQRQHNQLNFFTKFYFNDWNNILKHTSSPTDIFHHTRSSNYFANPNLASINIQWVSEVFRHVGDYDKLLRCSHNSKFSPLLVCFTEEEK